MKSKIPEDGPGHSARDFLEEIGLPAEVVNHIDAGFQHAHKFAEMLALQRSRIGTKADVGLDGDGLSIAARLYYDKESLALTTNSTDPETDALMSVILSKALVHRMVVALKKKYSGDEIRAIVGAVDQLSGEMVNDLLGDNR
jgi:hypothetical protein